MPASPASRYGFIDAVRGVAACLVMLQHALYSSGLLGNWPHETLTGFIPGSLELGEAGVVAFFMVSGFVIPLSLEKTNHVGWFWLHRILRLYPLYLVVYLATIVLLQGGGLEGAAAYGANAVSHLLMIQEYVGQPNFVGGSWTLSIEMVWYLGLSGLFLVSLNRNAGLLVGLAVAASLVACVVCAAGQHLPMGRLSMLVCCVFGLVCYRLDRGDLSPRCFAALAAILLSTIAVNLTVGFLLFPGEHPSASFAMVADSWSLALVVFLVPFLLRRLAVWDHAVFAVLGQVSYSIYLVHGVVLIVLAGTQVSGVALLLATFGATLVMATATFHFIEAPPIRFGRRFGRRRRGAADLPVFAGGDPGREPRPRGWEGRPAA